jgi:hypothetical protein
MTFRFLYCFFAAITLLLCSNPQAAAQWNRDPTQNNLVRMLGYRPSVVTDGSGGGILVWTDITNSPNNDVWAQRVDPDGYFLWGASGVGVCTNGSPQLNPTATSDESGGVIIAWRDERNGLGMNVDVYAQKLNSSGAAQWTTNGAAICTATSNQDFPALISNGSGGAIIAWQDNRTWMGYDIYAQSINASGAVQWSADGVALCTSSNTQQYAQIVSDGAGGAIVAWEDYRSGSNWSIYAQRINASGVPQWTTNGVLVCDAAVDELTLRMISDGAGGVILLWSDSRGTSKDIYSQRLNASGVAQWAANGVAICTTTGDQTHANLINDGSGGAIITWDDGRGSTKDIYAQRINSAGAAQWSANGVVVCGVGSEQTYPVLTNYGSSGAIIAWLDARSASTDIYAQKIDGSGAVQWNTDGMPVSIASSVQSNPAMTGDGSDGIFVAWTDFRRASLQDIYVSRVFSGGLLPVELVAFSAVRNSTGVLLRWKTATEVDNAGFDIERATSLDNVWLNIGSVAGHGTSNIPHEYVFQDTPSERILPGQTIYYRLIQRDRDGRTHPSHILELEAAPSATIRLQPPFPNPATARVFLTFCLPHATTISVSIHDVSGALVDRVVDEEWIQEGMHSLPWNVPTLPSGAYYCRLTTPDGRFFIQRFTIRN